MIRLMGFRGEIPLLHPRLLPDTHAQRAINTRLEGGVLTPFRDGNVVSSKPSNRESFVLHQGEFLTWTDVVSAIPGPVATDRLYIFGDGAPKLRVGEDTYPLALARPSGTPRAVLRRNSEQLRINNTPVTLKDGNTRTAGGWTYEVTVRGGTATLTATHNAGVSQADTEDIIATIRYRNTAIGDDCVPALKIIRITSIQDNGGQTLDAFRSRVGSDIRKLENTGSTVRVNGTDLTYDFPPEEPQETEDIPDQNDPPTLTLTARNPVYPPDGVERLLFQGVDVNRIEAGQLIIGFTMRIEGLTNGLVTESERVDYVYAYTYVTEFDEESAPSRLTEPIAWAPGQGVRLTGFAAPPAGRGIDRMRIYRSETGASGRTDLYFIAERPVSTAPFYDSVDLLPIQEPIPSLLFDTPPDNLRGAVSLPNGIMAAFAGRNLYFCEPYQPHAWPASYGQRVDSDIVALAAFGTSIAVLTKANPYVAQGLHPDQMSLTKVEANLPCVSGRSVVDFGYFAAYASANGLATISSNDAKLVTRNSISRRKWFEMRPETMVAGLHEERYVVSHEDFEDPTKLRTSIIDLSGQTPDITQGGANAKAWFHEVESGKLFYMRPNGDIYEFDKVNGPFGTMRWRSKEFIYNQACSFSCALVDADRNTTKGEIMVKIFGDGRLVSTITKVNEVVRLKAGRLYRKWEIEVIGSMQVTAIYVAHAPEEIEAAMRATA